MNINFKKKKNELNKYYSAIIIKLELSKNYS
jgi:hypothetical protein